MRVFFRRWVPKRVLDTTYPLRERLSRACDHAAVDARRFWQLQLMRQPISDLTDFEKRYSSQNGEDGIIQAIFTVIGETNRFFVEFGVEDGAVCNTRRLRRRGWEGLQMDPHDPPHPGVQREFVTAENIEILLDKYQVPHEPDLLSIDVDGNDWWIWKAIVSRRPRVVTIEYNATIPPPESRTIAYDPGFRWDRTDYFGASLEALARLGLSKGYALVGCDSRGVNAFFVRTDWTPGRFSPRTVAQHYRPYGAPHVAPAHAPGRAWIEVA